jgi:phytoene dehydrogenase-like protein
MDARTRADAEATHITPAACITVHAALSEPLKFRTHDPVDAVMVEMLPMSYDTLRRDFDELRYGQFMPYPLLGVGSLSQFDPSRVPAGKAILHLWDYVPYRRPDGRSWDDTKREYGDRMLTHLSKFVTNIPSCVLKAHIDSPVDMERTTASPPPRIRAARIGPRRNLGDTRYPASSAFIWWVRSSIRAAACSAPAAPRR